MSERLIKDEANESVSQERDHVLPSAGLACFLLES